MAQILSFPTPSATPLQRLEIMRRTVHQQAAAEGADTEALDSFDRMLDSYIDGQRQMEAFYQLCDALPSDTATPEIVAYPVAVAGN